MIEHVWTVFCRMASFDVQTNAVSLLSIIESVATVNEPSATHPALLESELVSLWKREDINKPESGQMRAYYIDPGGKESPPINLQINLTQGIFHRTRINISGLAIFSKGEYSFKIELQMDGSSEWILVTTIPFIVMVEPLPQL